MLWLSTNNKHFLAKQLVGYGYLNAVEIIEAAEIDNIHSGLPKGASMVFVDMRDTPINTEFRLLRDQSGMFTINSITAQVVFELAGGENNRISVQKEYVVSRCVNLSKTFIRRQIEGAIAQAYISHYPEVEALLNKNGFDKVADEFVLIHTRGPYAFLEAKVINNQQPTIFSFVFCQDVENKEAYLDVVGVTRYFEKKTNDTTRQILVESVKFFDCDGPLPSRNDLLRAPSLNLLKQRQKEKGNILQSLSHNGDTTPGRKKTNGV